MLAILQLPVVMARRVCGPRAPWRAQTRAARTLRACSCQTNVQCWYKKTLRKIIGNSLLLLHVGPGRGRRIENEGQARREGAHKASSRKLRVNNQEGNQGGNREETCEGNRANREVTCESSPKQRGGLP